MPFYNKIIIFTTIDKKIFVFYFMSCYNFNIKSDAEHHFDTREPIKAFSE